MFRLKKKMDSKKNASNVSRGDKPSRWLSMGFSPGASPTPWLEMEKYLGSALANVGTGVSGGGESMWIPTKKEKQNIEQRQQDETKYEW